MKKIFILYLLSLPILIFSQNATEILKKSDKKIRGNTSYAEISIQIIRPKWEREMRLKNWSKGDDYALSLVTYPAKEKGIVFLKRKHEMWNYMPSIERRIKMPPSMMLQSWMGTDLTNDDLVKQSSIVKDYKSKIIETEDIGGLKCWKIELTPKEDAPVVWGKIIIWIDQKDWMQMQVKFYDEDDFLVNEMHAYQPKIFDGRKLPAKIEFIPKDNPGNKTLIIYHKLIFDQPVEDRFFSINNMKRVR